VSLSSEHSPSAIGTAVVSAAILVAFAAAYAHGGSFGADARLFPRLVAIIGGISAAAVLVRALRQMLTRRAGAHRSALSSETLRAGLLSYGTPVLYGILFYLLGFWAASAICLAGLLLALGERRPVLIVAVTAGTLLSIYLVFTFTFRIHMPGSAILDWIAS
jgi:hypothetical protein